MATGGSQDDQYDQNGMLRDNYVSSKDSPERGRAGQYDVTRTTPISGWLESDLTPKERKQSRELQMKMCNTPAKDWSTKFGCHPLYMTAVRSLVKSKGGFGMSNEAFRQEILKLIQDYNQFYDDEGTLEELRSSIGEMLAMKRLEESDMQRDLRSRGEATSSLPVDRHRSGRRHSGQKGNKSPARDGNSQSGSGQDSSSRKKSKDGRRNGSSFNDENVTRRRPSKGHKKSDNQDLAWDDEVDGFQSPSDHPASTSDSDIDSHPRKSYKKSSSKETSNKNRPSSKPLSKQTREALTSFLPKSPKWRGLIENDPDFRDDIIKLTESAKTKTAAESLMDKHRRQPERRRSAYLPELSPASEDESETEESEQEPRKRHSNQGIPLNRLRLAEDLKFDGTESWNAFHSRFELAISGYEKDQTLASHLMNCLTGSALKLLLVAVKHCNASGKPKPDYKAMCRLMARNFYRAEDKSYKLNEFHAATKLADEDFTVFRARLLGLYMDAMPGDTEEMAEEHIHAKFLTGISKQYRDKVVESKNKSSVEIAGILDQLTTPIVKNPHPEQVLANEDYDENEIIYDSYEYNAETQDLYDPDDFDPEEEYDEDGNYCGANTSYPPRGIGHRRGATDGALRGMPYRDYQRMQNGQYKNDSARYNGRTPPQFRGRRAYRGGSYTPSRYQNMAQGRGRGYNPNYNQRRGFGNRNNYNGNNYNNSGYNGNFDNQNHQQQQFQNNNSGNSGNQASSNTDSGCSFCGKGDHGVELCPALSKIQSLKDNGKKAEARAFLLNLLSLQ